MQIRLGIYILLGAYFGGLSSPLPSYAQCNERILYPSQDAQVWSYDPTGKTDRGTRRPDIVLQEWTERGVPTTKYGLIQFDLAEISDASLIDSALLSLYYDALSWDPGHAKDAGSNEFFIYRLLGPWDESVSWNQLPPFTDINKVLVPESDSLNQDYLDLDITPLVRDILAAPDANFGFLLKAEVFGLLSKTVVCFQ